VVSGIGLAWYRTQHPQAALQAHAEALNGQGLDFALALGVRQADAAAVAAINKALIELRQQGKLQNIGAQYGLDLGAALPKPQP
jgi:ABC-type amino acid transport substrate-binding protein